MMNMTSEDLETYVADTVKKLEAQHPDITIMDLADHSKMLLDDHPLTRTSNEIKHQRIAAARQKPRQPSAKKPFTTIGQTSGCLPFHAYASSGKWLTARLRRHGDIVSVGLTNTRLVNRR